MTIILDTGEFWIESHKINFDNIPAASTQTKLLTLNRAGNFGGISNTIMTASNLNEVVSIQTDPTLNFGDSISTITVRAANIGGVARNSNVNFLIFMRK